MKKIISILLIAVMLLSLAACNPGQADGSTPGDTSSGDTTNNKPGAPDWDDDDDQKDSVLEDYYSFGPEEMIIAKNGLSYAKHDSKIDGKTVYKLVSQGWNGEIWAKSTSHMVNSENVFTVAEVREELAEKKYKYAAITFQLSEGASIGAYHCVPILSDDFKGEVAGFLFNAGGVLGKNANYLDVYGDRFAVYSEGKQIHIGDPINANQWYTFVCELQLDADKALYGVDSYVNVGLTNGNSLPVYVSEVRYYTNDSYKTDYVGTDSGSTDSGSTDSGSTDSGSTDSGSNDSTTNNPSVGSGYVEMDATELVAYKPSADVYSKQGEVFGRTDVYGAVFQSNWSVEVMAKTTASKKVWKDSSLETWTDVRSNFKSKGYQYVAIDFAMSEGSTIRAIGCVPPAEAGGNIATTGLTFTAGQPLVWAATCKTDEQKSYFQVYSEGKEVKVGDTINAGQWYTVVVKLLVDGGKYGQGEDGWSSVAFNVGNGKMIYFSTVRYYLNDSFKSDFVG